LKSDLSDADYKRVLELLSGGAASVKAGIHQALQEAIEGWGTDERLLYNALDRALTEGVAQEILVDTELNQRVKGFIGSDQYLLFRKILETRTFTPMMRLEWATTATVGTDEDLVFELCQQYGKQWYTGSKIDPSVDKTGAVVPEVDAILKSELDTRDYWKAIDLMRGEPDTEEERLGRAKESLERERGGVSASIMDAFSHSGGNADDAWREYRATYNRALEDGKLTPEEQQRLRQDERYSKEMTSEYREAKSTIAQWAATIAVAIVGIAATILTAGAAGPFVLALGGKALFVAEAMVLAAALKVGINRAIQGEGYDVTSTQAVVDAVSASVEVGLNVVGGQLATRFVEGASATTLARTVTPAVSRAFGKAGTRILAAGLENSVGSTIGGVGEGVVQGLADEKTWASGVEGALKNMGTSVGVNALMSGATGFVSGATFKSFGEAFAPRLKGKVPDDPTVKIDDPTAKLDDPTLKVDEPAAKVEDPATKIDDSQQGKFRSSKDKPKGLTKSLDQIKEEYGESGAKLVTATEKEAERILKSGLSKAQRGPVATGVYDPVTGQVYFGRNFSPIELTDGTFAKFKENLHPLLKKRLQGFEAKGVKLADPSDVARAGTAGSHSEIVALDKALKAREVLTGKAVGESELSSFLLHNRNLINAKGLPAPTGVPPRCVGCFNITEGVTVIGNE